MRFLIGLLACMLITSFLKAQVVSGLLKRYSKSERDQYIHFEGLGKLHFGIGRIFYDLQAISSSGLPVEYKSSDTTIAEVRQSELIIKMSGEVVITAFQEGNNYFKAAPEVHRKVSSVVMKQIIDYEAITEVSIDKGELNLLAICSSGLPIVFSSQSSNVKVSGNRVVLLEEGEVIIIASQSGNKLFLPTETVIRFNILPCSPALTNGAGIKLK